MTPDEARAAARREVGPMTAEQVINDAIKGEGCLGKAAPDEPVFVLRARDVFAAAAVRSWANLMDRYSGGHSAKTVEARALAGEMDTWRLAHGGGKVPD